MKKFLKKEIVSKKTVGQILVETAINCCVAVVAIFICLAFYSDVINVILDAIISGKLSPLSFSLFLLPVILIFGLTFKLGIIVIGNDSKK